MSWFAPKSPVSPAAGAWIQKSMDWCFEEFEAEVLTGPVLLPEASFFPSGYTGSAGDLESVLPRLCARMGVDRALIDLELIPSGLTPEQLDLSWDLGAQYSGVAGHYLRRGERLVVAVSKTQLNKPLIIIAVIAHELAHVRLLGEERIDPERPDCEQLTDLLTVALGLGVFTANASFEVEQWSRDWRTSVVQSSSLGYLSEEMFGYALACYLRRRFETDPPWADKLDLNPRVYMRQALRYLEA